jgi:hypothetical protein
MHKRKGVLLTVILGVFLLLPLMVQARSVTPIDSWTKTNNFIPTAVLNAVADNGTGTYVAVGNLGIILSSTNSTSWTVRVPSVSTQKNLWGVAYGAAAGFTGFVAVGDSKAVSTSIDGVDWNPVISPTGIIGNLKAIAFGNGLFVAVGDGGRIFTSPNATVWSQRATTLSTDVTLLSIIYAQGRFTAVGTSGRVLTSEEGLFWEKNTIPSGGTLQGIAFGVPLGWPNPIYVAVNAAGTVFVSTDGLMTWTGFKSATTMIAAGNLKGVAFANGFFSVVGNKGIVYFSENGIYWTAASVPTKIATGAVFPANIATNLRAVGSNGTVSYAVGESGTILISTSPDMNQWRYASTSNPAGRLSAATYGNGLFVTAGQYGNIFTSTDGLSWAESRLTKEDNTFPFIESITYSDAIGLFVAVGDADALNESDPVPAIFTSADGLTWVEQSTFLPALVTQIANRNLYGVAVGSDGINPLFVAVGETGLIMTSPDGITWTSTNSGTNNLNAVTYASGTFVAVGDKGTILTSPNGATWTPVLLGTTVPYFQSIAFGNSAFVAVASNGNIYFTANPTGTWQPKTTSTVGATFFGVAYGTVPGFTGFVAVGNAGSVWESSEGNIWAKVTVGGGFANNLEAVAFGNNAIVATGAASSIITKAP